VADQRFQKYGHAGQTYDRVGPTPISGPGNARQCSGLDAFDLRTMFQGYFDRSFASTETGVARVRKLLGHTPRSYEGFAAESAVSVYGSDRAGSRYKLSQMKSALTLLLLIVSSFATSAFADASKDEKDILAVLATWKQAALQADAATLGRIFHPDLTYSHNNAKIENKAQAIAGAIAPETKTRAIEYHDVNTHVYGTTAVMTGKFDITTAAGNVNHMHVLIVWLKGGPEGWQMVARHSVKLP